MSEETKNILKAIKKYIKFQENLKSNIEEGQKEGQKLRKQISYSNKVIWFLIACIVVIVVYLITLSLI